MVSTVADWSYGFTVWCVRIHGYYCNIQYDNNYIFRNLIVSILWMNSVVSLMYVACCCTFCFRRLCMNSDMWNIGLEHPLMIGQPVQILCPLVAFCVFLVVNTNVLFVFWCLTDQDIWMCDSSCTYMYLMENFKQFDIDVWYIHNIPILRVSIDFSANGTKICNLKNSCIILVQKT